ncbi:MAG: AAA family ATPase [Bacteroidetes bacterium]|nr:AAA family ATPase [Bacteroidota bacterium]
MFATLAKALEVERDHLLTTRREITLCGGMQVGSFAGFVYYRFEIPEETLLRTTERVLFTIGRVESLVLEGNIISIDNQYFTVALPRDIGPVIPEARCSWNHEAQISPIIDALNALEPNATIPSLVFQPDSPTNNHVVGFAPASIDSTPADQVEAVRKILQNKVTILWGAMRSGKTHTLALAAATYLKAGKRVLFVAPTNDNVDEMLLRTVDVGRHLELPMESTAVRVDLPSLPYASQIAPFSFEHQLERMREEKRKAFQERVQLLRAYWRVRIKQILHEEYYQYIVDLRSRAADAKRHAEQISKDIRQLGDAIQNHEKASVLERLKKGYSKEDVEAAQRQLQERQQQQKRFQTMNQSLTDEAVLLETNAPITQDEQREFKAALKKMDELGGLEKVTQAVNAFVAVDEPAILRTKQFIATSVATAFIDPVIRSQKFDLVLIDESQSVNLPTLAALASLAKEKCVVAGDPFQLQPESSATSELSKQWLQRDVFLHIAETDELSRLFDWTEQHAQYCVLLRSLYATTPRLSLFTAAVLYDEKISVFVPPTARGRIFFLDTSEAQAKCRQYAGRKRILPYNEHQTKKVLECIKHALQEQGRRAGDIGVIVPFTGPTLYTKMQLRLHGMKNIEVGTPATFAGARKKAVILDTTMAGVDYTVRAIDDKKIGEHRIARIFNTVFSCVEEDLYVLADMNHFRTLYKDRLFVRLLMLLQAEADQKTSAFGAASKKFDELDREKRAALFEYSILMSEPSAVSAKPEKPESKSDAELAIRMQAAARHRDVKALDLPRDFEKEIAIAVERTLGYRMDINLLSQFVGGDVLFHSTLRAEQAMELLPKRLCENEREFRSVMEQWNLLIYELSGGSKTETMLFAQTNPEARIRQDLKNLRAYYSADVQAIMQEGKQKIAVEVSRVFQDLVGKAQPPANAEEWSKAYVNFLARLESYLSWIEEQLRK